MRILGCTFFGSSCVIEDGRFYESRNSKLMLGLEVFFVLVRHVWFVSFLSPTVFQASFAGENEERFLWGNDPI